MSSSAAARAAWNPLAVQRDEEFVLYELTPQ